MFLQAIGFGIVTSAVMALAAVLGAVSSVLLNRFLYTPFIRRGARLSVLPHIGRIGLTQSYI